MTISIEIRKGEKRVDVRSENPYYNTPEDAEAIRKIAMKIWDDIGDI